MRKSPAPNLSLEEIAKQDTIIHSTFIANFSQGIRWNGKLNNFQTSVAITKKLITQQGKAFFKLYLKIEGAAYEAFLAPVTNPNSNYIFTGKVKGEGKNFCTASISRDAVVHFWA